MRRPEPAGEVSVKTGTFRILNLGAGAQSTVCYMRYAWDLAVFADTGEEPAPVYRHLKWLIEHGKTHGRAPIVVVGNRPTSPHRTRGGAERTT